MKLYYQQPIGRAEGIKLVLHYGKAEYERVALPVEELHKLAAEGKVQADFGMFPVLERDGKFYSYGHAILRLLGKEYGLYPEDQELQYQVESFLENYRDLVGRLYLVIIEKDEERKKQLGEEALTTHLPNFLNTWQTRYEKSGFVGHLAGEKLTVADIQLYAFLRFVLKNDKVPFGDELKTVYANFPKLEEFYQAVESNFEGYQP